MTSRWDDPCLICHKRVTCGGSRGLCKACYPKRSRLVKLGMARWEDLIEAGRAMVATNNTNGGRRARIDAKGG